MDRRLGEVVKELRRLRAATYGPRADDVCLLAAQVMAALESAIVSHAHDFGHQFRQVEMMCEKDREDAIAWATGWRNFVRAEKCQRCGCADYRPAEQRCLTCGWTPLDVTGDTCPACNGSNTEPHTGQDSCFVDSAPEAPPATLSKCCGEPTFEAEGYRVCEKCRCRRPLR